MRMVLAGMVSVGTAFAVVLSLGFWIHGRTNAILDSLFGFLAAVAIAVISGWIMCLLLGYSPWRYALRRTRQAPMPSGWAQRRAAAQQAYAENPEATATCEHLQPIERAMRFSGVRVSLLEVSEYAPVIMAQCRINVPEVNRVFNLPAWVYYKEGFQSERPPDDTPRADIFCGECLKTHRTRAIVSVLHPAECRTDTPWFPTPP